MPDLNLSQWILAVLAAVFTGMGKTGVAGIGTLAVPLMAQLLPAGPSTGALLPMLIMADRMAVAYYKNRAEGKYVLRTLPAAFEGILAAWAQQKSIVIPEVWFRRIIGIIV
jgi:hypothetical protein